MKYYLLAAILFCSAGTTLGQEDIKAKHAAYARCTENIEKNPNKAFEYCSDYLLTYPNDDKRLIEFAGDFVSAYRKISQYVNSVPLNYFIDRTEKWAVYTPGLLATIPSENITEGKHTVVIKREFGSPDEERLLAKAESLYKNQDKVERELFQQWRYLAQEHMDLPDGEPRWWMGPVDGIQSTEVVSNAAVLYYYNLSQKLRNKVGNLTNSSFEFSSSSLKYEASIKKLEVYEHSGKSFNDVYVANMTLTWGAICGSLCGSGFTRNKIVVMSATGEILEMFLDDPANGSSWIA